MAGGDKAGGDKAGGDKAAGGKAAGGKMESGTAQGSATPAAARPTQAQRAYLVRGLDQPGGKLPLFDARGQRYSAKTIRSCLERGWAEPWFENPIKPDWLVCRLTTAGRRLFETRRTET